MSCRNIQRLIQSCVDAEATAPERAVVDAHVAACAACRAELEGARRLVSLLVETPSRRVSDQFEQRLMEAVVRTAPAPGAAAGWERFRLLFEWRLRSPALVAAGSLALGLLAAVVTPRVLQEQAVKRQYLAATVERHRQLELMTEDGRAEQDLDAVDASVGLATGDLITE